MNRFNKSLAMLLLSWGSVAGYMFGADLVQNARFARAAEQVQTSREKLARADDLASVFRNVGKAVEPSVVNIRVRKTLKMGAAGFPQGHDDLLRRFFPDRDGDGEPDVPENFRGGPDGGGGFQQEGTGSGVIMDVDGSDVYILTNNHVAGDASEIVVTLNDGRQIEGGKTVGADPKTDIAVVKIKADRVIPARWGDSGKLEKGDWIVAFGSPFGYIGSMTHGIVSALDRQAGILGQNGYENFIQVDAPINPGNSGGPLCNLQGEVVGINTAIATRSGSFSGIGFAVPSNQAKFVYNELKAKGKIVRGYLGVAITDVSKEPAAVQNLGYKGDKGVLVSQTYANTPATGKLEAGDIVTALNGKPVQSVQELRDTVAKAAPGSKLTMTVFREGKTQDVVVTLGEQPDNMVAALGQGGGPGNRAAPKAEPSTEHVAELGLTLRDATDPQVRQQYGIDPSAKGAVVTKLQPGSPAFMGGLREGDVITRIGGQDVASAEDAAKALAKQEHGKGLRFYVTSGGAKRFVFVQPKNAS